MFSKEFFKMLVPRQSEKIRVACGLYFPKPKSIFGRIFRARCYGRRVVSSLNVGAHAHTLVQIVTVCICKVILQCQQNTSFCANQFAALTYFLHKVSKKTCLFCFGQLYLYNVVSANAVKQCAAACLVGSEQMLPTAYCWQICSATTDICLW